MTADRNHEGADACSYARVDRVDQAISIDRQEVIDRRNGGKSEKEEEKGNEFAGHR
jgi:hypothetical protein